MLAGEQIIVNHNYTRSAESAIETIMTSAQKTSCSIKMKRHLMLTLVHGRKANVADGKIEDITSFPYNVEKGGHPELSNAQLQAVLKYIESRFK